MKKLVWRSYISAEALSNANWPELINKWEFAKAASDKNSETFVVHVLGIKNIGQLIHLFKNALIAIF